MEFLATVNTTEQAEISATYPALSVKLAGGNIGTMIVFSALETAGHGHHADTVGKDTDSLALFCMQ